MADQKDHLNVAIRKTTATMEGALKGVSITVRPPTGYESLRMSEIANTTTFADGVMWILSQLILEWDLDLPISEETLKSFSMAAIKSIRDVTDEVITAFDAETLPLSEDS